MSVRPAAEALGLLVEHAGPGGNPARRAALAVVLRTWFLTLAESRGLLEPRLAALWRSLAARPPNSSGAWPRLRELFERIHAERGGRLFAPETTAALDGIELPDATVLALLDRAHADVDADTEVELLGSIHEQLRDGDHRHSSTHYTPRALAAEIVARTLAPLLRARSPASLRVCDPAMGCGVFVLAACRLLGRELDGGPLRAALANLCGVDEDPDAVELAKLSVWLETRATQLDFHGFDHALRHGDALVGLEPEQLRRLHWDPSLGREHPRAVSIVDEALAAGARLREQLERESPGDDPAAARRRAALFEAAEPALSPARALGDRLVQALFCSTRARARGLALDRLRADLDRGELDPPAPNNACPRPLHWWIDLPWLGPAGVDAVVGNPPFAGKNALLAARGPAYLAWLERLHPGAHGNADYAAHFFRRADTLIAGAGTIGLVATNTIGQGDTRATGLAPMLATGAVIYAVTEHLEWPGAADVTVSIVHLARGPAARGLSRRLGHRTVAAIDSRLRAHVERPDPARIPQNRSLAFIGTYVLGRGFELSPAQRDALVDEDPRNAERIRPYIGGRQLNTSPTQTPRRYAIDFEDLSLEAASAWPDLLEIVRREVKPARDRLRDNPDGRRRKRCWWQHGRATPSLHAALAPLSRCLVTSLVNKHLVFAFQPATRLFSHKLCVFPLDSWAAFAVLQSRIHASWAWLHSSTMRNAGINYSPSDCFETFVWPPLGPALEQAGERLDRARRAYMIEAGVGLTKAYNAIADPDCSAPAIVELRELHQAIDRAALAAYAWTELEVPPYPAPDPEFADAIVDRLYALNSRRSQEHAARTGS